MRTLLLFTGIVLSVFTVSAQYTVTKVVGKVKNLTNGEILKTGSKMSDNDKLQFSGPSDLVRLIVLGKGTYVLQANPKAYTEENTVIEILKSNLHLKSKEGYLSGRAGNFETIPDAFETESGYNDKNRIAPQNKYLFDKEQYPVSDGSRFFIQIVEKDKPAVVKQLTTKADTLIINSADFKTSGDAKNASFTLGYFSKTGNNSQSLIELKPYFDTNNEMDAIIKVVMNASTKKDKSDIEKECYKEVYEALGKPSDIDYIKAFNKIFAKKKSK